MFRARASGSVMVFAALALALSACSSSSPGSSSSSPQPVRANFPLTLTDDDGVRITIHAEPRRIVTFAPSNTEIVFALGLGDRLVGVSGTFDDYPERAKTIEHIGGAGEFGVDPNIEKVVSLHPDLMLAISGGDQWKTRLRDLGIPVFTVNATDLDDLLDDIRTIGRVTGAVERAAALTVSMRQRASAVGAVVSTGTPTPCFFEAYYPPLTSIGPKTFIFDLLRRAGCAPVSASAASDYPQWSVDQLVRESPDVYLVSSESGVSAKSVGKRPGFSAISAVRDGHIYMVNSDLITRPGPRVIDGLELLAKLLHPAAFPAAA
jgi:iron complex transport system substrate-binding protein